MVIVLVMVAILVIGICLELAAKKKNEKSNEIHVAEESNEIEATLKSCIKILRLNVDKNYVGHTLRILRTMMKLYRSNPKVYVTLLEKYEETFNVFHSVLLNALEQNLIGNPEIHKSIFEMLNFPLDEFVNMEKMLNDNKKMETDMELMLLNKSLQEEITILKGIQDLKKID